MCRQLVSVAATLLLLPGCNRGGESEVLVVRQEGTVSVPDGATFRVELEANQTTPYRWHLSKVPDPAIVDLVSSDYQHDPGSENLAGAGGTSIWTFRAVGPGTTSIRLAHVEIGEDVPKRSDFSVTVEVLAVSEPKA